MKDPIMILVFELLRAPHDVDAVAATIPAEARAAVLDKLIGLRGRIDLAERALLSMKNVTATTSSNGDRLLDVHEAAKKLGRSRDWLYRRADKLPFVVKNGRSVQFSEKGIEQWIATQVKKGGRR